MASSDWLIIELSDQAETAGYLELESALHSIFGSSVEIFIPIYHEQMGSYVSTNTLFEGYVFVKDSDGVRNNIDNIRDHRFFQRALKSSGRISTVSSREIGVLRKKLKNSLKKKLVPGSKVKVLEGIFQNLSGEVISMEDNDKIANVKICCMSREIIAPIPTTCVEESYE